MSMQTTKKKGKRGPVKGTIYKHTKEHLKNYIDALEFEFFENSGLLTLKRNTELIKENHQGWNMIKILMGMGYVNRISRGCYEFVQVPKEEDIEAIIKVRNQLRDKYIKEGQIRNRFTGKTWDETQREKAEFEQQESSNESQGAPLTNVELETSGNIKYFVLDQDEEVVFSTGTEKGAKAEAVRWATAKPGRTYYLAKVIEKIELTVTVTKEEED